MAGGRIDATLKSSNRRERGQDMVEYAMLTLFVCVPIVLAAIGLPSAFEAWSDRVAAAIPGAAG